MTANLTPKSLELFLELADAAADWSGTPLVELTSETKGNLTHLKRAGLLTTFTDRGCTFADFTDEGRQLAAKNGFEIVP